MIIGYTALHYGSEYLAWAIRSIQDVVDEIWILYTQKPSYGHKSEIACPESEEQLFAEAMRFLHPGKPFFWSKGTWGTEGEHRNEIIRIARERGAELVVSIDSDEVWDPEELKRQIEFARAAGERDTLVPFVHFWRSFNYFCQDPSRPVRIIKIGAPMGSMRFSHQNIPVLHFGYALREEIVRYKIAIHGHRDEWREDWLEGKFMSWKPGQLTQDVHPTCGWNTSFGDYFWNVKPVPSELKTLIDKHLSDHPYHGKEVIR